MPEAESAMRVSAPVDCRITTGDTAGGAITGPCYVTNRGDHRRERHCINEHTQHLIMVLQKSHCAGCFFRYCSLAACFISSNSGCCHCMCEITAGGHFLARSDNSGIETGQIEPSKSKWQRAACLYISHLIMVLQKSHCAGCFFRYCSLAPCFISSNSGCRHHMCAITAGGNFLARSDNSGIETFDSGKSPISTTVTS